MNQRKIILYIACSVDGYIAGPNDNLDFLSMVERPSEDYGYQKFTDTIDAVIMGRKTYDKVLSFGIPFPHSGRNCFVVTKTKPEKTEHVTFWNSDPDILVRELLKQPGKDVFVDGGASLVDALMKHNLIDRYIISQFLFLSEMESHYSNREDRRFNWNICKPIFIQVDWYKHGTIESETSLQEERKTQLVLQFHHLPDESDAPVGSSVTPYAWFLRRWLL